ncbi:MAG: class I SAM-dependent methyltransferase [Acidimicrobiia bacterium]
MTDSPSDEPVTAADRWRELLAGWAIPASILEQAPESPWRHDVAAFAVDATLQRDTTSARWAREVLPPSGGTVLDVGCGGGRAALALVPPATELIGVDPVGAMLDEFVRAAASAGVARRTVHGAWPDVASTTPVADVAISHHVAYDVGDIVPFLWALTDHARLAVVLEVPVRHPMSAWSAGWRHFWGVERPDGPTHLDLVAVLRELGLDPEVVVGPRRALSTAAADPRTLLPTARRRLCLTPDRDDELAAWLDDHPPAWVPEVATLRWAGEASAV